MKNKWSQKKVRSIQKWLIERWPDLFALRPDQLPLSLSIHKEILKHRAENPELSSRLLNEALNRHVTSYGYLYGMQKNPCRVGLDGNKVEPVSAIHREWARKTLRAKQKLAQKARKEKLGNLRGKAFRKPLNKYGQDKYGDKHGQDKHQALKPEGGVTAGKKTTAPVIRYKASRKKLGSRVLNLAS